MSETVPASIGPTSGNPAAAAIPASHLVRIAKLADHVGENVLIRGWLYNKRSSGKLHFLEVRDGSGIVQAVVFKGNVTPELFATADPTQTIGLVMVRGVFNVGQISDYLVSQGHTADVYNGVPVISSADGSVS